MTAKQVFEYTLVELNKREAPSLLLEDYNYFINKSINQYINKAYNLADVNQQKTDDLRVLKATAVLEPNLVTDANYIGGGLLSKAYEVDLPDDYLHILNCIVEYDVTSNYKCYNAGSKWQQGAKRLTADMFSQIINNYYLRPTYKNPYYYINNINIFNDFPTLDNQVDVIDTIYKVAVTSEDITTSSKITITLAGAEPVIITASNSDTASLLSAKIIAAIPELEDFVSVSGNTIAIADSAVAEISISGPGLYLSKTFAPNTSKRAETRYGNKSKVRMEIRYGKDNSIFELAKVYVDYIKAPQFIRLTQDQVDEVEDNSQILEFPDYVAQEIVNELVRLLLENSSDPRLQTHIPISQSIANPAQEQQKK
jgi:hypothetical protein